jgi:hypothetical protein
MVFNVGVDVVDIRGYINDDSYVVFIDKINGVGRISPAYPQPFIKLISDVF